MAGLGYVVVVPNGFRLKIGDDSGDWGGEETEAYMT